MKLFFFIICAFLIYSCKGDKSNQSSETIPDELELSVYEENTDKLNEIVSIPIYSKCSIINNNLSEIASDVTFVPIDFAPPINDFQIANIELSENNIFLSTIGSIISYDRQGKFIQEIGSKGMGPEEFINISTPLQLDRKNELIYASDLGRQRVIVFRFNGTFFKTFPLKDGFLALLDSSIIALRQPSYADKGIRPSPLIKFIDHDGKEIKTYWSKYYPLPKEKREIGGPDMNFLWNNKNVFYYLEYGTDTIFRILGDSIIPSCVLVGEQKLSITEHFKKKTNNKPRIGAYIMRFNSGIFESNRFMIFRMSNDYEHFFMVYDKKEKQLYRTYYKDAPESRRGSKNMDYFFDNMFTGLNFNPLYQSMDKAIALISAIEICKRRQEILNFIDNHPSDKSMYLKQIVQDMTEEHNSLMMIVSFK